MNDGMPRILIMPEADAHWCLLIVWAIEKMPDEERYNFVKRSLIVQVGIALFGGDTCTWPQIIRNLMEQIPRSTSRISARSLYFAFEWPIDGINGQSS